MQGLTRSPEREELELSLFRGQPSNVQQTTAGKAVQLKADLREFRIDAENATKLANSWSGNRKLGSISQSSNFYRGPVKITVPS